jgi:hypothetical protein
MYAVTAPILAGLGSPNTASFLFWPFYQPIAFYLAFVAPPKGLKNLIVISIVVARILSKYCSPNHIRKLYSYAHVRRCNKNAFNQVLVG